MGKLRDASKERYWRELVRRQGDRGETVAGFCAREGVSVHQPILFTSPTFVAAWGA
ncbi:MAG TPA: hypothetical protein VMP01_00605 [Pirellulaceae bacterium]|nr:hypothetical protein [Pirellulaceae bacterium]